MNFFEILPRIGNNMHSPFLAHLTQGVMWPFVITFGPSSVRPQLLKKYSPLKPLGHLRPNFGGMVGGWFPSKIVSGSPNLQPIWSLLLQIKKGMKF
jgi:hypothetical protein